MIAHSLKDADAILDLIYVFLSPLSKRKRTEREAKRKIELEVLFDTRSCT